MRPWREVRGRGWVRGLLLLTVLPLAACVDPFLEPEPPDSDDPAMNFDLLWQEFDRHYSFFGQKNVDWDEAYGRYRPRVDAGTSARELFLVVSEMLSELQDGHVSLLTPFAVYEYRGWKEGHPENFNAQRIFRGYMAEQARYTARGPFVYGRLRAGPAYVHISSFSGDGFASGMDEVLEELGDVSSLVVDIRSNGGGSDLNMDEVVGRFTDRKRVYRYFRYRNGPEHDDFTDFIEDAVEPLGWGGFEGRVALLTNRRNFSTAEDFTLAMRTLPNVVVVGDTTGGGMGNPISRELPNGWRYRLSRWVVYDADRVMLMDGQGLVPDVSVQISPEHEGEDRDTILETALEILARDRG